MELCRELLGKVLGSVQCLSTASSTRSAMLRWPRGPPLLRRLAVVVEPARLEVVDKRREVLLQDIRLLQEGLPRCQIPGLRLRHGERDERDIDGRLGRQLLEPVLDDLGEAGTAPSTFWAWKMLPLSARTAAWFRSRPWPPPGPPPVSPAVLADNGNIFQAQKVDLRGASFTQIIQDGLKELPSRPSISRSSLLTMTKAQAEESGIAAGLPAAARCPAASRRLSTTSRRAGSTTTASLRSSGGPAASAASPIWSKTP